MNHPYKILISEAGRIQKENRKKLDRHKDRDLLKRLPELHEAAFKKINCLECANCCKNHSPTFKTTDIKRISKFLKLKEGEFIENYLKLDEENDYVLQKAPCPFLQPNNECMIYEARPGDCANYPYTDKDIFVKKKNLSIRNSLVCPAVVLVLENL